MFRGSFFELDEEVLVSVELELELELDELLEESVDSVVLSLEDESVVVFLSSAWGVR